MYYPPYNIEELKNILAAKYDLYELMDILELGPVEFLNLITDYIEENSQDIQYRIQSK